MGHSGLLRSAGPPALLLVLLLPGAGVRAAAPSAPAVRAGAPALLPPEGLGGAEKGGVFPEVLEVKDDDEARALRDALDDALGTRDEEKVLAALRPFVTKRHKSFVAPLKKLVVDRRDAVAEVAAAALGSQGDKGVAPLLLKVVTHEVRERTFLKGALAKAAAIESLGRLGVSGGFEPIMKMAESMLRDPELRTSYAPAIARASIRYFGLTKEKRAVSFLIDHVDEPQPADVNAGSNPPAEYWKARYEAWVAFRPEVVWALKEITGMEFETGRRWKAWFDEEGRKLGLK